MKVIVTDGDPQETSQLNIAISKFMPNTYRQRCAWHIIDRGWKSYLNYSSLGGFPDTKRKEEDKFKPRQVPDPLSQRNKLMRTLYRWMFSWAQSGFCESHTDYELSKALFFTYIRTPVVELLLGENFIKKLLEFLRKSIFALEDHWVYYPRHAIFHLETHSNCAHEGMNNGLKNSSISVGPQHSLNKATRQMSKQVELKSLHRIARASQEEPNTGAKYKIVVW